MNHELTVERCLFRASSDRLSIAAMPTTAMIELAQLVLRQFNSKH
jgi:hypothetical protein